MTFELNRTISLAGATKADDPADAETLAMLSELQGNILKGHGRENTVNMFLSMDGLDESAARGIVSEIGTRVTTALDQLLAAREFRKTGADGGTFIAFFLTAKGYADLGLRNAMPPDAAFTAGMQSRRGELNDPVAAAWDKHLAAPISAMLLLADDNAKRLGAAVSEAEGLIIKAGVALLGMERGLARKNGDGQGIEHFGYVDGRSQPLVIDDDIEEEKERGGIDKWDPTVPLTQALIRDPNGKLDVSHGSYFVFRKLEQNVKGFKTQEAALAEHLKLVGDDDERAGASVIGRFENGTPVLDRASKPLVGTGPLAVPNNFNYAADGKGMQCPFAGHIRKTNPRRADTQKHLMLRRGITYGDRYDGPNDGRIDNKPERDVGLLFMAYMSDVVDQFEFTQKFWANNEGFDFKSEINLPVQPVGLDPTIGQVAEGATPAGLLMPDVFNTSFGTRFPFHGFVTLKGGDYFFAPCISFLRDPRVRS